MINGSMTIKNSRQLAGVSRENDGVRTHGPQNHNLML